MQALFAARKREETDEFKDSSRHRAGIEGTHSPSVRTMGLRRSRYIGLPKTHLGFLLTFQVLLDPLFPLATQKRAI